jgi:O-succinylbenzoate synthase
MEISTRPYRRPFARPLKAAWGTWSMREGLLIKIRDQKTGKVAFGEVAPLSTAIQESLPPSESLTSRTSFLDHPCTAFGLWSAETSLSSDKTSQPVRTAALLSLDAHSVTEIARLRSSGTRTFKVKVGMGSLEEEWKALQEIALSLEQGEKLRLDPNRSWKEDDWRFWKPRLNGLSQYIQFIEEPFVKGMSPRALLREANASPVALALDESLIEGRVTDWADQHWPGYWVVKPSLMGDPENWLPIVQEAPDRVVLSSTFETGIGLSALIRLAARFPGIDHGLGTQAYFDDGFGVPEKNSQLYPLDQEQQEAIWTRLPHK